LQQLDLPGAAGLKRARALMRIATGIHQVGLNWFVAAIMHDGGGSGYDLTAE